MTEEIKLTQKQQDLVEKHHDLIYWYAHMKNLDVEEWYGELAIKLCETALSYNESSGIQFSTLFTTVANNAFANIYRNLARDKRQHAGMLSIDKFHNGLPETNDDVFIPELEGIGEELQEIVRLRMEGYTQGEISDKMGISQPYISKALSRLKKERFND